MRDLIVVGFPGTQRAADVLSQVVDLNADWAAGLHLEDAVAVYRTADGKLRVDQSVQPTSKDAAVWGGALGVVIGSLLALPLTGGASAAVAAAAIGAGALTGGATGAAIGSDEVTSAHEKYGISDDFVRQVGGMVQPGQSAVFFVGESDDPAKIAEHFRGYGGAILRTTLRPEQEKRVQQALEADRTVRR